MFDLARLSSDVSRLTTNMMKGEKTNVKLPLPIAHC